MSTIALLSGNSIDMEILDGPLTFLRTLEDLAAPIKISGPFPFGVAGCGQSRPALSPEMVRASRDADVILSGVVCAADSGTSAGHRPHPDAAALLELRNVLGLSTSAASQWVPGDHGSVDFRAGVASAQAKAPAVHATVIFDPDRRFGAGATALFAPAPGVSHHRAPSGETAASAWLALAALLDFCPDLAPLDWSEHTRDALAATFQRDDRTPGGTTVSEFHRHMLDRLVSDALEQGPYGVVMPLPHPPLIVGSQDR